MLTCVVRGGGAELPFALTRWKRYDLPVLIASGMSAAVFSFVFTWIRFDYCQLAPSLLVAMFVIRLASGALLTGLLSRAIARALLRAGVGAGSAAAREAGAA